MIVAIDGRSGVGKSTLAGELAQLLGATVIDGDDFFAGGVTLRSDDPQQRAADCIDWRRLRPVLEALRKGQPASWHAFDWEAFDGSLEQTSTVARSSRFVVLEGVYSGRPELADLVDLRIVVRMPEARRMRQLVEREGTLGPWELQWHEAEEHYFSHTMPAERFDLIIDVED